MAQIFAGIKNIVNGANKFGEAVCNIFYGVFELSAQSLKYVGKVFTITSKLTGGGQQRFRYIMPTTFSAEEVRRQRQKDRAYQRLQENLQNSS
jgi:hypothetical protein